MDESMHEVQAEVAKHRGVIAIVHAATGHTRTFLAPNIALASVDALEGQRTELLRQIDQAGAAQRSKLQRDLTRLEADLRRARDAQEAARRTAERVAERRNERGDTGTAAPPAATTPSTNHAASRVVVASLNAERETLTVDPPIDLATRIRRLTQTVNALPRGTRPATHQAPGTGGPLFRMRPGSEAGWSRHLAEIDARLHPARAIAPMTPTPSMNTERQRSHVFVSSRQSQ